MSRSVRSMRTTIATAGRAARSVTSADHRVAARAARLGIEPPHLPRRRRVQGQVWAVTMVRNEIDILPGVLDHLARQGVDRILVSDNGSTDGTLEELERREALGQVLLARDREPAYYQAAKMTRLARAAWWAGADWIVPFDADELWFADVGLLADRLRSLPGDVVQGRMVNTFPMGSGGWGMDTSPQLHGKVAFRAHALAALAQGNHAVDRPGVRVAATQVELKIAHLPWRSFEQFAAKVSQGALAYAATRGEENLGNHWRRLGAAGRDALERDWEAMVAGQTVEGMHWCPRGPLVSADPRKWRTWDPEGNLVSLSSGGTR